MEATIATTPAAVAVACVLLTSFYLIYRRRARRAPAPQQPPPIETVDLPNGKSIYHLRSAETDLLYGEIFKGNCYRLPESDPDVEKYSLQLSPDAVVVDVGANIGMFALWAAWHEQTAGRVRVLSFECVPSTYAVLKMNAELYTNHFTLLEAHGYGLGSEEKSAIVHHHPNFSIWSTSDAAMDSQRDAMLHENIPHLAHRVSARDDLPGMVQQLPSWLVRFVVKFAGRRILSSLNATEAVECRFRRLSDAVFRDGKVETITLLKVDVEGAEMEVLNGIDAADWRRIEQVAMECENERLAAEATALLEGHGFSVRTWISDDMKALLPTSEVRQLIAKRFGNTAKAKGTPLEVATPADT